MKKRNIAAISLVILLALTVAVAFWWKKRTEGRRHELVLYGNVDIRKVDLGFRVSGRVEQLFVDEGDEIAPGQLLALIENDQYGDQLKQAEAKYFAAHAQQKNAEWLYKRRQELIKSKAVSQEDYETSNYNFEQLSGNLKDAQAALELAKTYFEDTQLIAPSHGTILTRIREPGSVVNFGEPIFTLSLSSPIWIRTYVNEVNLGKIYPGMAAAIYTDTPSNPVYHGHIGFISPVAEFTPKTVETTDLRTDLVYRLRVIVDDPDVQLKQGMPVTIVLKLPKPAAEHILRGDEFLPFSSAPNPRGSTIETDPILENMGSVSIVEPREFRAAGKGQELIAPQYNTLSLERE